MKQSLKAYLPKINDLTNFENVVSKVKSENKFIAHLTDDAKPLKSLIEANKDFF